MRSWLESVVRENLRLMGYTEWTELWDELKVRMQSCIFIKTFVFYSCLPMIHFDPAVDFRSK